MNSTTLDLDPADLLDKWGFGDGDLTWPWVARWRESSWPADFLPAVSESSIGVPDPTVYAYTNPDALLALALRTKVVPRLGKVIPTGLMHYRSLHNPFRIEEEVFNEDSLHGDDAAIWHGLLSGRFAPVVIPAQEVFALCERAYPARGAGWLALFEVMASSVVFANLSVPGEPLLSVDTFTVGFVLDELTRDLPDEALLMATSLLITWSDPKDYGALVRAGAVPEGGSLTSWACAKVEGVLASSADALGLKVQVPSIVEIVSGMSAASLAPRILPTPTLRPSWRLGPSSPSRSA